MTGITAEYVKKFLETCWLCSKPLGMYCLEQRGKFRIFFNSFAKARQFLFFGAKNSDIRK